MRNYFNKKENRHSLPVQKKTSEYSEQNSPSWFSKMPATPAIMPTVPLVTSLNKVPLWELQWNLLIEK